MATGFRHGVFVAEVPTSLVPPVRVDTAIPLFFGTAPLHLSSTGLEDLHEKVNYPVLAHEYADAVRELGFSYDWRKYSLCEAMFSQFALFNVAPAIFINVLDPRIHKKEVPEASYALNTDKQANLGQDVIFSSVKVKAMAEGNLLETGTDFSLSWDKNGNAMLNALPGGALLQATEVIVAFDVVDPEKVTKEDIIGGYDVATDKYEGLELVNEIFPRLRIIPNFLVTPGWSSDSEIAAIMLSKAGNINGCFRGEALIDIPSDAAGADKYSEVAKWKNDKNIADTRQFACWPMLRLGERQYHFSVQLAGLMGRTDAKWRYPHKSPSNENLQCDATVTADGKQVWLGREKGEYLNSQGVVTAINFIGGWRCFGNRTACYPANTDPKDAFIPIRRMFDWIGNTLVLTYWQMLDRPITKRLVETIVDSINIWLNGLASQEVLVGEPRCAFLESENPLTDVMDGIIRFHVYSCPPPPAEQIEFILEFDVGALKTLFGNN